MDPELQEKLKNSMDEYGTIPDYENVPADAINFPNLRMPLWKHQYQAAYLCLKAEALPPITTDEGEIFYSRSGLLPMPTGTGKTLIIEAISQFTVPEPSVKHIVAG